MCEHLQWLDSEHEVVMPPEINKSTFALFMFLSRHRYRMIEVKQLKASGSESLMEWIKESETNGKSSSEAPESTENEESKPKKKINVV